LGIIGRQGLQGRRLPADRSIGEDMRRSKLNVALIAMAVLWLAAGLAMAQGSPQEPADQFVPVKNLPSQEQLPAAALVMTAYAFVWAALLVYVWTIWRRLMKVEREMRDLTARLGEKR